MAPPLPTPSRRRSSAWRVRRAIASALCLIAAALPTAPNALAEGLTDAQMRSRFLVNFLRFTEWPASLDIAPGAPLSLCVLGIGDPLEGGLAQLEGAQVGDRKLAVHAHIDAARASECQLLYVPDSELRRLAVAREAIGSRPVLIVGESEAILDHGGMIALRSADRHLAFVVNLPPARRAELGFSPQMLHAAAEVLR